MKSGCHGSRRQKIHQKMELAEWLVILIFKWKLRQFGETLRKTRQILENDETLRKTGIMQGIPALHDYQWIFASLLIWNVRNAHILIGDKQIMITLWILDESG